MKNFILSAFLIGIATFSYGQKEPKPTNVITISGEVESPVKVPLQDIITKNGVVNIGTVTITNHLGEKKGEAKNLKGILLRRILDLAKIKQSDPKLLSEYYFVFKGSDGYAVVYSWNELYNTQTGESTYLITEKDGVGAASMNESILMVSAADLKTGRRQLKSLSTIEVRRIK